MLATIDASRKKEQAHQKFLAALQGVDLDEESFERNEDIAKITGFRAQQDGFGIGEGLGHIVEDNTN